MQKILAFNIIPNNINIILRIGSSNIISKFIESNKQSEILVKSINELLKENNLKYEDIDIFSSTTGPGNFTSIKTALAVLKAIQISTHKKIVTNNMFELISFNQTEHDVVILDLNNVKYYIQNKNNYYVIYKKDINDFLEKNKNLKILTNDKNILNDNMIFSNFSNEKWLELIEYKAEHNIFTEKIEPLYIEEAGITKRKN